MTWEEWEKEFALMMRAIPKGAPKGTPTEISEVASVYFKHLYHHSAEVVSEAMKKCQAELSWFPTIAQIRERLDVQPQNRQRDEKWEPITEAQVRVNKQFLRELMDCFDMPNPKAAIEWFRENRVPALRREWREAK